jgi:hypothetical protein
LLNSARLRYFQNLQSLVSYCLHVYKIAAKKLAAIASFYFVTYQYKHSGVDSLTLRYEQRRKIHHTQRDFWHYD